MVWPEMGFGRAVGKHRWTETWGRLTANPTRDKRGHSASTNRRNQKGKGWYGDIVAQETPDRERGMPTVWAKTPHLKRWLETQLE